MFRESSRTAQLSGMSNRERSMTQETTPDRKKALKKSLNLPSTSFSMKANLVQNEPASLKRWEKANLYQQLREARKDAPRFSFHDGPPYANGSIHLGHMLNKVLKDMVVRSQTMFGKNVPYVPGWDCHGLPIEHKVLEEQLVKSSDADQADPDARRREVRKACRKYAEKYIKLQAGQMKRLLTVADYDEPYLTMNPAYEGAVLDVFAALVKRGLVYRDLKPVHWSVANQTALAEAELEYYDREDTSVFVTFELDTTHKSNTGFDIKAACGSDCPAGCTVELMIWTTTPWTLPANLAVAVHERFEYGLYRIPTKDGSGSRCVVLATELAKKVLGMEGVDAPAPLSTFTGGDLNGLTYKHPFIDDHVKRPVVLADYVTLEDGTGLVHTAPGHGKEDYETGKREGLPIYCPVREDGTFNDTAPDWLKSTAEKRITIWDANDLVVDKLKQSGHLFHSHRFVHSYPHDWRGKTPVIFRATEQWFVTVDTAINSEGQTLRDIAMNRVANDVNFYPAWGRNRMQGMLESRPDWCLSRQRAWGLPIPAFFPAQESYEPLLTAASIKAVADKIRQKSSDVWFFATAAELLADYDPVADPDAPEWLTKQGKAGLANLRKSDDIFDVWFESGSSWHAAIRSRFGDEWVPTDLYLEGSDQHRGWFQLSLLPAIGVTNHPPFKAVLTHGFIVDKNGRKMSKSGGNALEVEKLLEDFGADVCRWWVSSLNFENDIKADVDFFNDAGEEYRKVRNTLRYMLSNLSDFNHKAHAHNLGPEDERTLDAWALGELAKLVRTVRKGYEQYQFKRVHEAIFNFCNDTLSAVYLNPIKDRLYCDRPDSKRRRRTQSALYKITDTLIRLMAPILPHTADEAWAALHQVKVDEIDSVALALLPEDHPVHVDEDWTKVIADRDNWLRAVEQVRSGSQIDNPLDLGLRVAAGGEAAYITKFDPADLADLCGLSLVTFDIAKEADSADALEVLDLRAAPRCERSWKRDGTVEDRDLGELGLVPLSARDAEAVLAALNSEG